MSGRPETIDAYLAGVKEDQRAVLENLRRTIQATAPAAEECISYGIPTFRLEGRMLVSFGAGANHCAFYPLSASTVADFEDELKGYDTSKGTIRFPLDKPIPLSLVKEIVRFRVKENLTRAAQEG